jgi:hypothetical protein
MAEAWGDWVGSLVLGIIGVGLSLSRIARLWGERQEQPMDPPRAALLQGHIEREWYRVGKQSLLGVLPFLLLWLPDLPLWARWGLYTLVQGLFVWTTLREEVAQRHVEARLKGALRRRATDQERG